MNINFNFQSTTNRCWTQGRLAQIVVYQFWNKEKLTFYKKCEQKTLTKYWENKYGELKNCQNWIGSNDKLEKFQVCAWQTDIYINTEVQTSQENGNCQTAYKVSDGYWVSPEGKRTHESLCKCGMKSEIKREEGERERDMYKQSDYVPKVYFVLK